MQLEVLLELRQNLRPKKPKKKHATDNGDQSAHNSDTTPTGTATQTAAARKEHRLMG